VRHWWSAGLAGLLIGLVFTAMAAYMSVRWNNARVISGIAAVPTVIKGEQGGWVLDLKYSAFRDTSCPNSTEHILERIEDDQLIIWPIVPTTVNMLEKLGPSPTPHVRFELPLDIAPGTWSYVARASDFCEWLPGLVRTSLRMTRPVTVTVPEGNSRNLPR
jgi:hypothetical protein